MVTCHGTEATHEPKFLYPPVYLDVHPITPTHHHIGLVYFAIAASDQATLATDEHEAIRWFSEAELHDPAFGIQPDVLFYACMHASCGRRHSPNAQGLSAYLRGTRYV